MENRKTYGKTDRKKKILFAAGLLIAGLLVLAFVLYKIFVTPKVVVGLALNNAKKDLTQSMEYFVDENEKEIIQYIRKNGGKTEMDFEISKSGILEGVQASVVSNSDGRCSVSEINFNSLFSVETYKDNEQLLINTPIPGGHFKIEFENIDEEAKKSVFGDKIFSSPETVASPGVLALVTGEIGTEDFFGRNYNELKKIKYDVKKSGTGKVLIGNKTERADIYTVHIEKKDMERLVGLIKKYCAEFGIQENTVGKVLKGMNSDCDVEFKIRNFRIYEVKLRLSESTVKTAAFTGEENSFDSIVCYENDDIKNALRRHHEKSGNKISEEITLGDNLLFSFEKELNNTELCIGSGKNPFVIRTNGKNIGNNYIEYDDLEFGIEDKFMISSRIRLSKEYDEDFSFAKADKYIPIFGVSEREWNALSGFAGGVADTLKNFKLFQ